MTPFEVRANNVVTAIEASRWRVNEFGYEDDQASEAVSAVFASYVTWLVACEEARAIERLKKERVSFRRDIVEALPEADLIHWDTYIQPVPKSSLRQRMAAIWGLRVAFTHSDGTLSKIADQRNKELAADAPRHLDGLIEKDGKLDASQLSLHLVTRSFVHLRDILV
jgi:hypothetical protein